jgi:hypothetical protein
MSGTPGTLAKIGRGLRFNMNKICNKCNEYQLNFNRKYKPEEFLEGKNDSIIWIIGLNPKENNDYKDTRKLSELKNYFNDENKIHSYFKNFYKVSKKLYENMGKNNGVAHTDLVKCFSRNFPPKNNKTKVNVDEIISNCSNYLKKQIIKYKPKMIICNGSYVVNFIKKLIYPKKDFETYYIGCLDDNNIEIIVILSGFIGRIDDMAKRRLGKEIEFVIKKQKLMPDFN